MSSSSLPGLNSSEIPSIYEITKETSPAFLDRYSFLSNDLVGYGKNAICIKCKKNDTGYECAVKILRSNSNFDIGIKALSECNDHPNIVKVLDVIQDDHFVFIVTELLAGELLFTYLKQRCPLNESTARNFFIQIARGLGHIHSKNFIHRNLTMRNIMINSDGNLKILGFSSAAEIGSQKTARKLRIQADGAPPETILYKIFQEEADVWFLGVILYQMLTGHHPFWQSASKDTIEQIRQRTIKGEIQFYYNSVEPYSVGAVNLIKSLLAPDRAKRIKTNEILKNVWCSPSQNETITGFLTESGTIQLLEELSSSQRIKLITELQSIESKPSSTLPTSVFESANTQSSFENHYSEQLLSTSNNDTPSTSEAGAAIVELEFRCDMCPGSFKTKQILNIHKKLHKNLKYLCEENECGKQYTARGKLSQHIKVKHKRHISETEKAGKTVITTDAVKNLSCTFCGEKFKNTLTLKRHTKNIHTAETYECYMCHQKYSRSDYLKIHIRSKH